MTVQLLALLVTHQVEWLAPEACPDRETVNVLLDEHRRSERPLIASVRIDEPRTPDQRWRAVVMTPASRIRVVEAKDCERVTRAAVLVVSLAATELDAAAEAKPASPKASAVPTDGGVALPEQDAFPAGAKVSFHIEPLVGMSVGVLPTVGFSVGVAGSLRSGPWLGQVSLAQWFQSQTRRGRSSGQFDTTSASVLGCRLWSPVDALELGPCAGLEVGVITGIATGVAFPTQRVVFWAAALLGGVVGYRISPSVRPWAEVAAGANLAPPHFVVSTVDGELDVHRTGWPVGRLTIGVELTFQ